MKPLLSMKSSEPINNYGLSYKLNFWKDFFQKNLIAVTFMNKYIQLLLSHLLQ